jgi:hypothetical protein
MIGQHHHEAHAAVTPPDDLAVDILVRRRRPSGPARKKLVGAANGRWHRRRLSSAHTLFTQAVRSGLIGLRCPRPIDLTVHDRGWPHERKPCRTVDVFRRRDRSRHAPRCHAQQHSRCEQVLFLARRRPGAAGPTWCISLGVKHAGDEGRPLSVPKELSLDHAIAVGWSRRRCLSPRPPIRTELNSTARARNGAGERAFYRAPVLMRRGCRGRSSRCPCGPTEALRVPSHFASQRAIDPRRCPAWRSPSKNWEVLHGPDRGSGRADTHIVRIRMRAIVSLSPRTDIALYLRRKCRVASGDNRVKCFAACLCWSSAMSTR